MDDVEIVVEGALTVVVADCMTSGVDEAVGALDKACVRSIGVEEAVALDDVALSAGEGKGGVRFDDDAVDGDDDD